MGKLFDALNAMSNHMGPQKEVVNITDCGNSMRGLQERHARIKRGQKNSCKKYWDASLYQ